MSCRDTKIMVIGPNKNVAEDWARKNDIALTHVSSSIGLRGYDGEVVIVDALQFSDSEFAELKHSLEALADSGRASIRHVNTTWDAICLGQCKCHNSLDEPHFPAKMKTIDEDYGSLASGGSYEKLQCPTCGHTYWSQLPD